MRRDSHEFVCVLRVWSPTRGVGSLLRAFPKLSPEAVWKRGTRDALGRRQKHNGFNLLLAQGPVWKMVGRAARRRLRGLIPLIERGNELGASFVLDIGVVPGRRAAYLEARFPAEDLARLAAFGVELCLTSYPASSD
jgi:hypothetical protein